MLYRKESISEDAILAIWQIDETEEELKTQLCSFSAILQIKSASRRLEKLATLVLLKSILGKEIEIGHYPSGRPYLLNSTCHISISHTKGFVSVILSEKQAVAIDIEQISDKVKRVRTRFVSDEEYISPQFELQHLLLHWSAKEAVYKLLNRSDVDFRQDLKVEKFDPLNFGSFEVQELITKDQRRYRANYEVLDNFVLVYIVQSY